ncbi:MAG: site-specific integrase [Gammaproteobacteria bacterium]|nr:site-specific integrase [Gammaproteobacteria bacterium]
MLYKRNRTWWVRFTTPKGQLIRRSTGTTKKIEAQQFLDELKASFWKVEKLGRCPAYIWEDAVVKWLKENETKASVDIDRRILRWLDPYLRGIQLTDISRELIEQIAETKAKETSPSTANRHLALVRAILRRATHEWEWLEKSPKVRMFRTSNRRIRWITRKEAKRLLDVLPSHQKQMATFGLATGLRQRNVSLLEWSQVDLERQIAWIHADQAKARKAIAVPLNDDALAVLDVQKGIHDKYVFTYRGKPVWQVNTKAWRKAVKKAGLVDFRWHDLRHTWASWHVQSGTPLYALQELGGWESAEMVRRYAHLGAGHLAQHVGNVSIIGTNLAHEKS